MTAYDALARRLGKGEIVILDGGIGTELERRGVPMDPQAWCGPASLDHAGLLEQVHLDYIAAGADIITTNTYASSRLMLEAAGCAERFLDINRTAIAAARRARAASGRGDLLIAGSLSHMCPMHGGSARPDLAREPPAEEMAAAFSELASLLCDEGCDLLLLEMMFYPQRIPHALRAAADTGLPVWAGFSARRGASGDVLSFAPERDIPFTKLTALLEDADVAAAGVMHTPADTTGDALAILRAGFDGPLYAYPDSGYFRMPSWRFEDVIAPADLLTFARRWVDAGVQILGGCCGLSPEHIAALGELKRPAA